MNEAQTKLYFREWNAVRKALIAQGVPSGECDARRHALHVEALGAQKSSKQFTNADLDLVLGAFRAITQPYNLTAQLDAAGQARRRKLFVIDRLLGELGATRDYAAGIARRIGMRTADVEQMDEAELKKILVALQSSVRARARRAKAPSPSSSSSPSAEVDGEGDDEGDPF